MNDATTHLQQPPSDAITQQLLLALERDTVATLAKLIFERRQTDSDETPSRRTDASVAGPMRASIQPRSPPGTQLTSEPSLMHLAHVESGTIPSLHSHARALVVDEVELSAGEGLLGSPTRAANYPRPQSPESPKTALVRSPLPLSFMTMPAWLFCL